MSVPKIKLLNVQDHETRWRHARSMIEEGRCPKCGGHAVQVEKSDTYEEFRYETQYCYGLHCGARWECRFELSAVRFLDAEGNHTEEIYADPEEQI